MALNLKSLAPVFNLLYSDRMDITSTMETEDEDGATVNSYPTTPQQKDIPCRISFGNKDTPKKLGETHNKVEITPTIFCKLDAIVKAGDKVIVRRCYNDGTVYETYSGTLSISGKPNKYETHQVFELLIEDDA